MYSYSAVALLVVVAVSHAAPQFGTLQRVHYLDDAGQFTSSYQSHDGAVVQETGRLKPNFENNGHVLVKEGNFQYTSPEGIPVRIFYTADEFGFHPSGSVIPVAPPALHPTF